MDTDNLIHSLTHALAFTGATSRLQPQVTSNYTGSSKRTRLIVHWSMILFITSTTSTSRRCASLAIIIRLQQILTLSRAVIMTRPSPMNILQSLKYSELSILPELMLSQHNTLTGLTLKTKTHSRLSHPWLRLRRHRCVTC